MSLLDIRDNFRSPAAPIDEQIERVAIGALGILGVYPTYYAWFLVIGPPLHIVITAATRGRYYEPAHASVKHGADR
jgi:hypothetical protein